MKPVYASMLLPILVVAGTAGLLGARPFAHAGTLLDNLFGAQPAWTQVSTLRRDPDQHELTSGEHPRRSLDRLAERWRQDRGRCRVVFLGNSQMQSMSLAPGEARPQAGERTYFDLLAERVAAEQETATLYRLSAGGLSYTEALWYAYYLALEPSLRPDVLVVQLNYQAFWQGGLRAGMEELLESPSFRTLVEREASGSQPYADVFREALKHHSSVLAQTAGATVADSLGFGPSWEDSARNWLQQSELFQGRYGNKEDLMGLLYRMRLYFLRLRPDTARSVTGSRLIRSRQALEAMVDICRERGIRLLFFYAPLNPRVNLFKTPADASSYHEFATTLAQKAGAPLLNLEGIVPAALWGSVHNSPDPLHLGRQGHQLMAEALWAPLQTLVAESRAGR
jgi:hypothetical protein